MNLRNACTWIEKHVHVQSDNTDVGVCIASSHMPRISHRDQFRRISLAQRMSILWLGIEEQAGESVD